MAHEVPPEPLDIRYELTVLRGPDAVCGDGEDVKVGGVIGSLRSRQRLYDKVVVGIVLAILAGIGGTFTWVYMVGQGKGRERAEMDQMRRDLDEALCRARGGIWRGQRGCDTPEP